MMHHFDILFGKKAYTRDLRAEDIKGHPDFDVGDWGEVTLRALILRTNRFARQVEGIDHEALANMGATSCFVKEPENATGRFILQDKLGNRPGVSLKDLEDDYFCAVGNFTRYIGQPVCLLLFEELEKYLDAQREKDFLTSLIKYTDNEENVAESYKSEDILDLAASIFDEPDWPVSDTAAKKWSEIAYTNRDDTVGRGRFSRGTLDYIESSSNQRFQLVTKTPAIDSAHLEPDSSLGRVVDQNSDNKLVQLFVPTQSQFQDYKSIAFYSGFRGFEFEFIPVRLGGGFGARSSGQFPFYAAIASIAGNGIPVRLEFDRLEQFVSGIKRHPSRVETDLIVAPNGSLEALDSKILLDGGSIKNLSFAVASLSSHSAGGVYRIERKSTRNAALKNRGVLSGSLRGFGIPQALFNIEQQIDRIAVAQGRDPIEYRESIALKTGDDDISGKPLMHPLRNLEILNMVKSHPRWKQRSQRRFEFHSDSANEGKYYGTGFAFAMEAFGASTDKPAASIGLTKDLNLSIQTFSVKMGQGTVDGLQQYAEKIFAGQKILMRHGKGDQLAKQLTREDEDRLVSIDTNAAARGTYGTVHVLSTIIDIWLEHVWLPIIAELLKVDLASLSISSLEFSADGNIKIAGHPPLDWPTVASIVASGPRATVLGLGKFKNSWAYGEFEVAPHKEPIPIWLDRLAFGNADLGASKIEHVSKQNSLDPADRNQFESKYQPSRSLYATAGCLVDLIVDKNGSVDIEKVTVCLDAGRRLSDSRIKGQIEGGITQGIGHTLMEHYPSGPLGGQRAMNFDEYALPRVRNMPNAGIDTFFYNEDDNSSLLNEVPNKAGIVPKIPPPKDVFKGISEIAISPIAAAIANAIIDAIYFEDKKLAHTSRFESWPITADEVVERFGDLK